MSEFNWTVDDIERAQRDFSNNFMRLDCIRTESYDIAIDCMTECIEKESADIQPVDTKEILRHLDSMMICIGNAYDTSHGLLRSDMEFIEKQEKIIKELLEGAGK